MSTVKSIEKSKSNQTQKSNSFINKLFKSVLNFKKNILTKKNFSNKEIKQTIKKFLESIKQKITLDKIGILSSILIVIFFVWILRTFVPVIVVEAKYQSKQIASKILPPGGLKSLFIPDFSGLNISEQSTHKKYGIKIPKIYLDEPVVFNVNPNDKKEYREALKKGIAHASGSSFPDDPGIGYYFAHSSSPEVHSQYNAVFYLLGKLEKEDDIYIWHDDEKFHYKVIETKVTNPQDVSFLDTQKDEEIIVLQTCWPPGTTLKRLLVFAQRDY